MGAGAIVVAALIAAAVAATASTAIKGATSGGYDGASDAFGEWIKSFFTSFALGTATGGAGAAAGGGESAADAGMWAGMTDDEIAQMYAQAGASGTGTGAAVTTGTTAATTAAPAAATTAVDTAAESAMFLDPLNEVAAQDYAGQLLREPSEQLASSIAEPLPSAFDNLLGGKFSPTQFLQREVGGLDPYQIQMFNKYSDVGDLIGGMAESPSDANRFAEQQQKIFTSGLEDYLSSAGVGGIWGSLKPQRQGLERGIDWWGQQQQSHWSPLATSLGGGWQPNQDYNSFGGNNYGYGYR